jgi:hypothetical protein
MCQWRHHPKNAIPHFVSSDISATTVSGLISIQFFNITDKFSERQEDAKPSGAHRVEIFNPVPVK